MWFFAGTLFHAQSVGSTGSQSCTLSRLSFNPNSIANCTQISMPSSISALDAAVNVLSSTNKVCFTSGQMLCTANAKPANTKEEIKGAAGSP